MHGFRVPVLAAFLVCMAAVAFSLTAQEQPAKRAVNENSAIVSEFQRRVAEYVKLHKSIESQLGPAKPTASPEQIKQHERDLAGKIAQVRAGAKQGDIFSPEIAAEFRRLISMAKQGGNAHRIDSSLQHAEPVRVPLQINGKYPDGVPLQSTPPTLLINLPKLPPEVAYRLVGSNLAIVDVTANLVVDFMPDAMR